MKKEHIRFMVRVYFTSLHMSLLTTVHAIAICCVKTMVQLYAATSCKVSSCDIVVQGISFSLTTSVTQVEQLVGCLYVF